MDDKICSTIIVHGEKSLDLSETEKRLLCGDKKVDAYKIIPHYQASFFMKGFLQSRGYLNPRFETINETLHIYLGEKSKLKRIDFDSKLPSEEKVLNRELERLYLGKDLTPKLLDDLEKESKHLLRSRGYPCVIVKSKASTVNDNAEILLTRTSLHKFGAIKRDEIEGLHQNALLRYYPFDPDDPFDERLLELHEKRILRAQVLQGTYFLENCSVDGSDYSLSQKFIVGPPRTLRFGIGASTELGPMARVIWSNNRFKEMASVLLAKLEASFRTQSLTLSMDNFLWDDVPRRSLVSELSITRESQIDYEELLIKLSPSSLKWTRDVEKRGWTWTFGPSLESGTYHFSDKSDTRSYNTVALEASYKLLSHDYELFDIHPEEGDVLTFNMGYRSEELGFISEALRLDSSYVKLMRVGSLGRGTLVSGLRVSFGTLVIDDDVDIGSIPPTVKFYGGGSDDIRGFLLNTLPDNDGAGALTHAGLKLELRKTYFFIPSLETFLFVDGSYYGVESFKTDSTLFYSPGVGLRWKSPIGLIQGYYARALTNHPYDDKGDFFYLGLGGSF